MEWFQYLLNTLAAFVMNVMKFVLSLLDICPVKGMINSVPSELALGLSWVNYWIDVPFIVSSFAACLTALGVWVVVGTLARWVKLADD